MVKRGKPSSDQVDPSPTHEFVYVYSATERRNLKKSAAKRPKFQGNSTLDIDTKATAICVAPSVVSLVSFSGERVVSQSCGSIIETQENNNIVVTSLNLIRQPTKEEEDFVLNQLANNLKIVVHSPDDTSYVGEIITYDFHYNLLFLRFKSKSFLQSANLRIIDDGYSPAMSSRFRSHGLKVKPGDSIVVVGRHFYKPYDFMAAPGLFSLDRCRPSKYDCRELLSIKCNFTMCGDGAPVVNMLGDVIGITYYELGNSSPLLPINIICKWWDHYKKFKKPRHLIYGFEGSSLYLATLQTLERVTTRFPGSGSGVLVGKVQPGSCAESSGLLEDDVITKCDGKTIKGFFELWSLLWDKVGEVVELEVFRVDQSSVKSISLVVGESKPHQLNKWPRFEFE